MAPKVKAFMNAKARGDCICRVRASKLIECENSRGSEDRIWALFYTRRSAAREKSKDCFTFCYLKIPTKALNRGTFSLFPR